MKRGITGMISCGLITLMIANSSLSHIAGAQEYVAPPITISKDKVKIDGKVFYSHIVLEKQTLFSISKAYNVTIDEIYKYNPTVKENGLRKNDIIIIPAVSTPAVNESAQQVVQEVQEPVKSEQVPAEQTFNNAGGIRHTVKWYEDLASIAEKYNVTESAIISANNLPDNKVKNKQVLFIPTQEVVTAPSEVVSEESSVEAAESELEAFYAENSIEDESTEIDQTSDSSLDDFWNLNMKHEVNATLIMPFKATGSSSNRNNMDFYSGMLLAAKELKDEGINIHLNVYDTEAGINNIPEDVLKGSDIIVGPVSPNDLTLVADLVNGKCPIVSPLDQRAEKLTSKYSNIIQVPSSQYSQYSDVAHWIQEDMMDGDHIIMISEKETRQNDAGRVVKSIIDRNGLNYKSFSYSILEGRNIQGSLEALMTKDGVNRVIIASESEAFVNDAVRNLNLIVHKKYNLVLYAPAKIRTFETIEVENFHNTSLHTSLTYYIDYNDKDVQTFLLRYRAMFEAEPTQFSFQGYDIAKHFFGLISENGEYWITHLENNAEMLQNSFKFSTNGNSGHVNNGIRRIVYDKNYSIIAVE